MTGKQTTILGVSVGLALLGVVSCSVVGMLSYFHNRQESQTATDPVELIPLSQWVEIVPESYWVIGPFGPGLNNVYEPEQHADPSVPCKTPAGGQLQWVEKPILEGDVRCLDFRKAFGKPNTDDTAAYALTYVHSLKDQPGELLLGSDDTITVWLNGAKVHENLELRLGVPDNDEVPVRWKQGWNTLLIKVGNGKNDHLFFAKLRGPMELRASTTREPQ
jgi:hypothetical protein